MTKQPNRRHSGEGMTKQPNPRHSGEGMTKQPNPRHSGEGMTKQPNRRHSGEGRNPGSLWRKYSPRFIEKIHFIVFMHNQG